MNINDVNRILVKESLLGNKEIYAVTYDTSAYGISDLRITTFDTSDIVLIKTIRNDEVKEEVKFHSLSYHIDEEIQFLQSDDTKLFFLSDSAVNDYTKYHNQLKTENNLESISSSTQKIKDYMLERTKQTVKDATLETLKGNPIDSDIELTSVTYQVSELNALTEVLVETRNTRTDKYQNHLYSSDKEKYSSRLLFHEFREFTEPMELIRMSMNKDSHILSMGTNSTRELLSLLKDKSSLYRNSISETFVADLKDNENKINSLQKSIKDFMLREYDIDERLNLLNEDKYVMTTTDYEDLVEIAESYDTEIKIKGKYYSFEEFCKLARIGKFECSTYINLNDFTFENYVNDELISKDSLLKYNLDSLADDISKVNFDMLVSENLIDVDTYINKRVNELNHEMSIVKFQTDYQVLDPYESKEEVTLYARITSDKGLDSSWIYHNDLEDTWIVLNFDEENIEYNEVKFETEFDEMLPQALENYSNIANDCFTITSKEETVETLLRETFESNSTLIEKYSIEQIQEIEQEIEQDINI